MSYYLRLLPDKNSLHAWKIDSDVAFRIGVPNPENQRECYFTATSERSIWETLRAETGWFEPEDYNPFHEADLQPGEYYPRIARPIEQHFRDAPGFSPGARNETTVIAVALSQLNVLTRQLDRICQTVHPTLQTFDAFGHDIRNLLIIASTEVEAHWRGVLVANGVAQKRFTTNDYVRLVKAMRLDEYAVTFPNYPWLLALYPYKGWGSTGKPTEELRWYDSYNAVKHNREAEFERATLRHAFEAVSACVIMMGAQFGLGEGLGQRSDVQSFFRFSAVPLWSPSDVYIYPYSGVASGWSPINYSF
jgi:hypothetical protein